MNQTGQVFDVPTNLSLFSKYFFKGLGNEVNLNDDNEVMLLIKGFFLLYLLIVILAIITFKLGFAKKLPVLKAVVVYMFLIVGSLLLAFFGISYPIAESLLVAILVLGIYRFRLHQERKNKS